MKTGDLTLDEIKKFVPFLESSEFTLANEYEQLGFSKKAMMDLDGWKIVGLIKAYGSIYHDFFCMFERESDKAHAWCTVPCKYVERYIRTLPGRI